MFLRSLNNDQKTLFLGLAYHSANANGVVDAAEKKLIKSFSEELGISEEDYCKLGFEDICNKLVEISNRKELIEISFEILGLMMGDTAYDSAEKAFVIKLFDCFGLSEALLSEMEECLQEYILVYKKIQKITEK